MDLTPYKNCKAHKQWVYISNDEKSYRPCCYFKTNIDAKDIQDYQEQLSKLDIETNCEYCINLEKNGNPYSQRKEAEDTIRPNEFRITVSFDNLCNFKCTYCSSRYSTQIANEQKDNNKLYKIISEQGPSKLEFIKSALNQYAYHYDKILKTQGYQEIPVCNLNILGGEPLINPLVYEFLEWLSYQPYAKTTAVTFLTNGSVYDERIYEYSREFRYMGLGFSIDGTDDIFEFIRFNGKFSEVKKNIDRYYLLQDKKFRITFQYALSWMNVLGFADWYNWIVTSYPDLDGYNNIHMNKLVYPEDQSVDVIPLKGKQLIIDKIESKLVKTTDKKFLEVYQRFKTQVLTGEDNSHRLDDALVLFKHFDEVRKTDYKTTLKEVMDIIKS